MEKNHFKLTAILIIAALFFSACAEQKSSEEKEYSITEVIAAGPKTGETTKLIITLNEELPDLCADDIKINKDPSISLIKGVLIKTGIKTYELGLIPGKTDTIKVGLDPYRGFTGWSAKSVRVIAGFHFSGTANLTITGYGLPIHENKIEIPDNIAELPVVAIGDNAFPSKQLKYIIIPETIISIGNSAFYNNKLTDIDDVIPNSVTRIGNNAFANNQLTSITIPAGVESIGNGAFYGNQITRLDYFREEEELTSLPITKLTRFSGFNNNALTSIEIPVDVEEIGENAFAYNNINKIKTWIYIIDETNEIYRTNIIAYQDSAFMYNQLKRVRFFEGTTTIGNNAFSNNQIETVTFGSQITTIGKGAFAYNKIKEITIPDGVTVINEGAFRDNQLIKINFSNNIKSIGNEAFRNNQLEEVSIPGSVTNIGNEAFRNNQLTKISIGKNVTFGIASFGNGFEKVYNDHERAAGTYIWDINANEWKLKEEGEEENNEPGSGEEENEMEAGMQFKSLFIPAKIML